MCATCKSGLKGINRNGDNCPILLEKMIFNLFSHYMSMKKSKNSVVYPSASSYGCIRSALTHMYRVSGKYMDQEFRKELSQPMSVMKRAIASNSRQSGISLNELNKAIIFDVYKILCNVLHQVKGEDFTFAHAVFFNGMQFYGKKGQFCKHAYLTHSVEVGLLNFLFWNIERQSNGIDIQ